MEFRLTILGLRVAILAGIALLMLVPTGMCICCEPEDEIAPEQHEPGCPKVRKLVPPALPEYFASEQVSLPLVFIETPLASQVARPVYAVGHGPPRGRPIFLFQQTFLI